MHFKTNMIKAKSLDECTVLCEEWGSSEFCSVVVYSRDTMICQYADSFTISAYKTFEKDENTRVAFKYCGKMFLIIMHINLYVHWQNELGALQKSHKANSLQQTEYTNYTQRQKLITAKLFMWRR